MNSYNGFTPRQRIRALHWLKNEYAAGRRVRPTVCDACGQTEGIVEAHSEDYSEPHGDHIGKFGLCYTCHMMLHCSFKAPAAWARYRAAIANGATFEPFLTRNFYRLTALHLGRATTAKSTRRQAPDCLVLDEIEASRLLPDAQQ